MSINQQHELGDMVLADSQNANPYAYSQNQRPINRRSHTTKTGTGILFAIVTTLGIAACPSKSQSSKPASSNKTGATNDNDEQVYQQPGKLESTEIISDDPQLYNIMGNSARISNDLESAVKHYQKALTLEPDNYLRASLHGELGMVYKEMYRASIGLERLELALKQLEFSIMHYNNAVEVCQQLAEQLENQEGRENYAELARTYRNILDKLTANLKNKSLYLDNPEQYVDLINKFAESAEIAKSKGNFRSAEMMYTYALTRIETYFEGISTVIGIERVIRIRQEHAECCEQLGLKGDAITSYKAASELCRKEIEKTCEINDGNRVISMTALLEFYVHRITSLERQH